MATQQKDPAIHYGWHIVWTGTFCLFACLGLGRFALGMILPAMGRSLHLSYSQMGLIGTVNFAGYLVAVLFCGPLADRFGYRRLIVTALAATGLTNQVWIIISSVIVSFVAILFFARTIGEFILHHPAVKILALSFLITIGVTIFMEGLHKHVPKGYIYLPMGFALLVEILQMRYEHTRKKILAAKEAS